MAKDKVGEEAAVAEAAAPAAPELIMVRSLLKAKPDGGEPVALWEKDGAHPDGEAFVAGSKPVKVAKTDAVVRALADKKIEEAK